ncbi:MAG: UxaA family hydrolase, partial [Limnohabitans sp.]|nr:UxaA family hydrolase [Limnohabitans sp.]
MSTPLRSLAIRMHPNDNVAIIANDGGLPAGTVLPEGLTLRDKVPQGHKVALKDIAVGQAVLRYNVPVGYAREAITAGSWVHERLLDIPPARELQDLPMATVPAPQWTQLEGHTFEGYVNANGSVGTRNLLAISTTVQCVAGVVKIAVERIEREL